MAGPTPEEEASFMESNPDWRFAQDPWAAVAYCTQNAAQHRFFGRHGQAAHWVSTGLILVADAANPYVYVGEVLGGLADTYGLR